MQDHRRSAGRALKGSVGKSLSDMDAVVKLGACDVRKVKMRRTTWVCQTHHEKFRSLCFLAVASREFWRGFDLLMHRYEISPTPANRL